MWKNYLQWQEIWKEIKTVNIWTIEEVQIKKQQATFWTKHRYNVACYYFLLSVSIRKVFHFFRWWSKKKWKNLRNTYMWHIKTNKTKTGQTAKNGNGQIRWKILPFFNLQKHRKMSLKFQKLMMTKMYNILKISTKRIVSHSFQETTQTLTQ